MLTITKLVPVICVHKKCLPLVLARPFRHYVYLLSLGLTASLIDEQSSLLTTAVQNLYREAIYCTIHMQRTRDTLKSDLKMEAAYS